MQAAGRDWAAHPPASTQALGLGHSGAPAPPPQQAAPQAASWVGQLAHALRRPALEDVLVAAAVHQDPGPAAAAALQQADPQPLAFLAGARCRSRIVLGPAGSALASRLAHSLGYLAPAVAAAVVVGAVEAHVAVAAAAAVVVLGLP